MKYHFILTDAREYLCTFCKQYHKRKREKRRKGPHYGVSFFCPLFFIQFVVTINAMQKSALFRNAVGDFSVGDFEQNPFHYLWVKKLASPMAADQMDCALFCVGEPKCRSWRRIQILKVFIYVSCSPVTNTEQKRSSTPMLPPIITASR